MLRLTLKSARESTTILAEGQLVGPWVKLLQEETERLQGNGQRSAIAVDLSLITYADHSGRELLRSLAERGFHLVGPHPLIVELLSEDGGS